MIVSIACFMWTVNNRETPIVRALQPVFLCMLCIGTFVMAASIIPSSLQEPVQGLDIACMASVWLLSIGFVTSFSVLFSKIWRLNKLWKMSRRFQRGQIDAKDVLRPYLLLMALNLTLLITWTAVAPLEWTRVYTSSLDSYGRSTESYGTCYVLKSSQYIFLVLLVIINVLPVLFCLYQIYKSQKPPPSNFNESHYIGISLVSLLEAFALSAPLFFIVSDSPSADFVVESVLVTFVCLAILLPLFIPKYLNWNKQPRESVSTRRVSVLASSRSSSS